MTDGEKLVELLNGVLSTEDITASEQVADHLIAHGVTVQEWINVEERLPEFGQVVLAARFERNMYRAVRLERIGGEGVFWTYDGEHGFCFKYLNYWMPLPPAPEDMI